MAEIKDLALRLLTALNASSTAKGQVFYVDSAIGVDDQRHGSAPGLPFATVGYAHTQCVTGRGDTISCAAGHAETYEGAAAFTLSKNDVTVVGQGFGRGRPTFTIGTASTGSTASQVIVSGNRVMWKNCVFNLCALDAVVLAISVTGNDNALNDNEFICNGSATGVAIGVKTSTAANRFTFKNNLCYGLATNAGTTSTAQLALEGPGPCVVENNDFYGKMTQAVLNTAAQAFDYRIHNNRFVVGTGTKAIALKSDTTGFITNNNINVPSGTAPIVAAAGFVSRNSYSAAAGVTAGTAVTI